MSQVTEMDADAALALKNAWNGAIAASERLREFAPVVDELPGRTLTADELEQYQRAALAHANAAMALRGILERVREMQ
jgi:hypothetical protein